MKFEELKSLDLRQCATVGDIVDGMRYCAFGARMLGEVARTIQAMAAAKKKPVVIYSGLKDSPLGRLLNRFVLNQWCDRIISLEYGRQKKRGENAIIVGGFSERYAEAIYDKPTRAIFINPFDMARPGQIKDGYFPDAVFAARIISYPSFIDRSKNGSMGGVLRYLRLWRSLPDLAGWPHRFPGARRPCKPWSAIRTAFDS